MHAAGTLVAECSWCGRATTSSALDENGCCARPECEAHRACQAMRRRGFICVVDSPYFATYRQLGLVALVRTRVKLDEATLTYRPVYERWVPRWALDVACAREYPWPRRRRVLGLLVRDPLVRELALSSPGGVEKLLEKL